MFSEIFSHNIYLMILVILWTLPWKGLALWKAARNHHKWWFIAILLTNTLAILDILYIYLFSKYITKKKHSVKKTSKIPKV